MHNMVDYSYYRDAFLGVRVPERDFPRMAARARDTLNRYKKIYRVAGGAEAESMALCAMAEALYELQRRKNGVSYASLGGVSVRYDDTANRDRSLLDAARVYLDISRAVTA